MTSILCSQEGKARVIMTTSCQRRGSPDYSKEVINCRKPIGRLVSCRRYSFSRLGMGARGQRLPQNFMRPRRQTEGKLRRCASIGVSLRRLQVVANVMVFGEGGSQVSASPRSMMVSSPSQMQILCPPPASPPRMCDGAWLHTMRCAVPTHADSALAAHGNVEAANEAGQLGMRSRRLPAAQHVGSPEVPRQSRQDGN
ncbi:hypothetical protein BCR34DRAFT_50693 [Clohesyomyces aquaticus]|uniref:Uncharacterized protein n=1 Tax=Clohesyomyces aquaticus TaxID=1231657 RepID=A0A1Y2A4I1_9PLEO|nr:hypothetical protein BCR34DRAFT_50693 [Clohesyomyces aquaticus]